MAAAGCGRGPGPSQGPSRPPKRPSGPPWPPRPRPGPPAARPGPQWNTNKNKRYLWLREPHGWPRWVANEVLELLKASQATRPHPGPVPARPGPPRPRPGPHCLIDIVEDCWDAQLARVALLQIEHNYSNSLESSSIHVNK